MVAMKSMNDFSIGSGVKLYVTGTRLFIGYFPTWDSFIHIGYFPTWDSAAKLSYHQCTHSDHVPQGKGYGW